MFKSLLFVFQVLPQPFYKTSEAGLNYLSDLCTWHFSYLDKSSATLTWDLIVFAHMLFYSWFWIRLVCSAATQDRPKLAHSVVAKGHQLWSANVTKRSFLMLPQINLGTLTGRASYTDLTIVSGDVSEQNSF